MATKKRKQKKAKTTDILNVMVRFRGEEIDRVVEGMDRAGYDKRATYVHDRALGRRRAKKG